MGYFTSVLLYLSTYLLSALLLKYAAKANHRRGRIVFFVLALIPPCLLAGLRYQVGTDYMNYYYLFLEHADLPFMDFLKTQNWMMLGLYFISRVAGLVDSPVLYYFLFAAVIYAPVAWRIVEQKDTEPVGILAFLFLLDGFTSGLNIMRQAAASSLCFFALKYVHEQKLLKYLITLVLAAAFHITAIVFAPVYYIWNRRRQLAQFNLRTWLIVIAYAVVALNFSSLAALLGEKYSRFGNERVLGRNFSLLLNFLWLLIFLLFHRAIVRNDPKSGLLTILILIGNILSLTGLRNTYAKRIGSYFTYCEFWLRTQLRYGFMRNGRWLIVGLVIIYSIAIFVLTYGVLGQSAIIPYQSVFGLR